MPFTETVAYTDIFCGSAYRRNNRYSGKGLSVILAKLGGWFLFTASSFVEIFIKLIPASEGNLIMFTLSTALFREYKVDHGEVRYWLVVEVFEIMLFFNKLFAEIR